MIHLFLILHLYPERVKLSGEDPSRLKRKFRNPCIKLGLLKPPALFLLCATQLLLGRWQDFPSNKTKFCTVLRKEFFFSCCWLELFRNSCRIDRNGVLGSGLKSRHVRNDGSVSRHQLHFVSTVSLLCFIYFLFIIDNGRDYLEALSFYDIPHCWRVRCVLRSLKFPTKNILWWKDHGEACFQQPRQQLPGTFSN